MIYTIILSFLATVTSVLTAISFSKKEALKKSNKSNYKEIKILERKEKNKRNFIIVIAVFIFIFSVIQSFKIQKIEDINVGNIDSLKQEIKHLQDQLESSKTEIIAAIVFERDYRNSNIDMAGDSVKVGRTIMGVFEIEPNFRNRNGFLFDLGKDDNRNRVSIYMNEALELVYRVIDNEKTIYSIKVPFSVGKFQVGKPYLIYVDYGTSDNYSFMRLFLNNKEMGILKYNSKIDFPVSTKDDNFKIGYDIHNEHPGFITFLENTSYQRPIPTNERIEIMKNIIEYYSL